MSTRHKNPQYNLRLSEELKAYLQLEADRHGCSLNQEIVDRLYATKEQDAFVRKQIVGGDDPDEFGYKQFKARLEKTLSRSLDQDLRMANSELATIGDRLLDVVCERNIRLKSASATYLDRDRLKLFIKHVSDIRKIRLAVRDYDLGGGVLVIVILGEKFSAIMDTTAITAQRTPREYEVAELIRTIDERDLLEMTEFIPTRIIDTRELNPSAAIKEVMEYDAIPLKGDIYKFLKIFSDFSEPEKISNDIYQPLSLFLKNEI
jgi:hypothetical protein